MIDENLPTFYIKKNDKRDRNSTIYFTHRGNDLEPAYSLHYPNPTTPQSKNRYAAALFDPYVHDILYGEVLLHPDWTKPTLSADAIRQNGGVPPPPEPILPSQFTIQLYNPDQQVTVRYRHKTWNSPASWDFEMPQRTFRQPSSSRLDRTQSDPAVADVTPKLKFSWRKDGKLTKDLSCLLSGMTTTFLPESKTKTKEPDITVSFFKSLREITLYEPNLYRVEMEDFKGLELVLLLGSIVIRDVYFGSTKAAFNVSEPSASGTSSGSGSGVQHAAKPAAVPTGPSPSPAQSNALVANAQSTGYQERPQRPRIAIPRDERRQPSPVDVRSREEIDAEHARIRHQQEWAAQEEQRRTRKLLEAEEKARRKRQIEVDKETKRLQKLYGDEERRAKALAQQSRQSLRLSSPPPPSAVVSAPAPAPTPAAPALPSRPTNHRLYHNLTNNHHNMSTTSLHPQLQARRRYNPSSSASASLSHIPPSALPPPPPRPGPSPTPTPYLHAPAPAPMPAPGRDLRTTQSSVQLFQPPHLSAPMYSNSNRQQPGNMKKRSGFFGFRKSGVGASDEHGTIHRKRSSMY